MRVDVWLVSCLNPAFEPFDFKRFRDYNMQKNATLSAAHPAIAISVTESSLYKSVLLENTPL